MRAQRPFGLGRRLRRKLLAGQVVLPPLGVILWLLSALFRLVDGTITPWVQRILTC